MWNKFFIQKQGYQKLGLSGMSQKGQKQVDDVQCNAVTSLVDFMLLYSKVNQGCNCKYVVLEVSDLFCPFLTFPITVFV